jgi:O-antigen/teichoic acid export membrane protein
VVSAASIALLAGPLLGLLGARYASAGATPLRILLIAFVPLTLVQVYFASCRATGKLAEAIVTGTVSGVVAVGAAAVAARSGGLAGMAWTWVVTQWVTGLWALFRLRSLSRLRADTEPEVTPAVEATTLAVGVG